MNQYKLFKNYKEDIKKRVKDLRVIYTDLDGTLLNHEGCLIKDGNGNYYLEAIKQLEKINKKDWDVVLVSGRNRIQLRYNAQIIGVKNYIAELGCELVHDLGEKVYFTYDNKKVRYDIRYGSRDLSDIVKLLKEKFPGKIESNIEWSKYRSSTILFFGEIDLDLANKLLEEKGYKGLVLVDNGFSSLVKLNLNVKKIHIYNLKPSGVNKSSAIKLDKKIRKLSTKNCIALGDSIEDLKMAGEVQFFFLMKNGLDHKEKILRELCNYDNVYVTEGSMSRGWVEVIDCLVS